MTRARGHLRKIAKKIAVMAPLVCACAAAAGGDGPLTREIIGQTRSSIKAMRFDQVIRPEQLSASGGETCFAEGRISGAVRRATVFLLSLSDIDDGLVEANFGTGSIVRGDDGRRRILTASHVVRPHGQDATREVLAFDYLSKPLGIMTAVYMGSREARAIDRESDAPDPISGDIAVLAPVRLFGRDAVDIWNAAGLELAERQSSTLFTIFPAMGEAGSAVIGDGASGAAVLDENDRVAGVISQKLPLGGLDLELGRPAYMDRLETAVGMAGIEGLRMDATITVIEASRGVRRMPVAAGIALPVSGREARRALGIDREPERLDRPGYRYGLMAAFPQGHCRSSRLVISGLEGLELPAANSDAEWVLPRVQPPEIRELPGPHVLPPIRISGTGTRSRGISPPS